MTTMPFSSATSMHSPEPQNLALRHTGCSACRALKDRMWHHFLAGGPGQVSHSRLVKPVAVAGDHCRDDVSCYIRAGSQLCQRSECCAVDLDLVGIVDVLVSGEALDEDNTGDGGLREAEDDELAVAGRQGAYLVGNHLEGDAGQLGQLQQPFELGSHDGRATDDAMQY